MEKARTVFEVTKYIKTRLEGDPILLDLKILGEISNFKNHSRGHWYFTLKDEKASISAIMFANYTFGRTIPKDGDKVEVTGRISLYEPSGTYNIQVTNIEPQGQGALYAKLEELRKKYEALGWFDEIHKKPIPKFPKKIGVVTSPTGAVIEDIRNTINRRYRLTEILLYPAIVQGPDSAQSIAKQIYMANEINEVDVLIVGRGGGSIEDLWGFNEEAVINAIYNSRIPIITAIGHEPDVTISDFVSDKVAPTPTAAAMLATPDINDLIAFIEDAKKRLRYLTFEYLNNIRNVLTNYDIRIENASPIRALKNKKEMFDKLNSDLSRNFMTLLEQKQSLVEINKSKLKSPIDLINQIKTKFELLRNKLETLTRQQIDNKNYRFSLLNTKLQSINPLSLMDKGYAVVKKNKNVIKGINDIDINDILDIEVKDGIIQTKVTNKEVK